MVRILLKMNCFDFQQCDSNTIKLINKDIFFFFNHCLTNRVVNKTTDLLHLHLALVKPLEWMDPSLNVVAVPPKVKENHFWHCYAKLLKMTKKRVDENIKDKKKRRPTVARTIIKFMTHFFWCRTVKKKYHERFRRDVVHRLFP